MSGVTGGRERDCLIDRSNFTLKMLHAGVSKCILHRVVCWDIVRTNYHDIALKSTSYFHTEWQNQLTFPVFVTDAENVAKK